MKKEILYSGERVYFSIHKTSGMVESDFVRLVAEEGKAITNGEDITTTADVPKEYVGKWTDCDRQALEEFATETDYLTALARLGVQ